MTIIAFKGLTFKFVVVVLTLSYKFLIKQHSTDDNQKNMFKKRGTTPVVVNGVGEKNENTSQFVERLPTGKTELGNGKVTTALPGVLGSIDAETAKYLDPSIVIDPETNRRIKRMVRFPSVSSL